MRDELTKPLAQETLQFRGPDGRPTGTATLGDRMRTFRKRIAKEEKELETLWKEWAGVQQLIIGIGIKILGPEAVQAIEAQPAGKLEDASGSVETTKIVQEVNTKKIQLSQDIEAMSAGLVEKMYSSEKARHSHSRLISTHADTSCPIQDMNLRTQKQRQGFLTALGRDY